MALSTLFQVLLRTLVSIVVQFQWRQALDDAIAMYFPTDPASLHSFPPCLLYQQLGGLFIVPVKKYRLLFIRFITSIFGRSIGTLTVREYRCGPLDMSCCEALASTQTMHIYVKQRGTNSTEYIQSVCEPADPYKSCCETYGLGMTSIVDKSINRHFHFVN